MEALRYDKTDLGREEIAQGRKNLRGKLRTVLFLVEPGKDVDAIQQQIAAIGAPADAIAQLATDGYIAPVGGPAAHVATAPAPPLDPATHFRVTRKFMHDMIVNARGIRAFAFTLKLDRCATLDDLAALMPEYTEHLAKSIDLDAARSLVHRTRAMLAH